MGVRPSYSQVSLVLFPLGVCEVAPLGEKGTWFRSGARPGLPVPAGGRPRCPRRSRASGRARPLRAHCVWPPANPKQQASAAGEVGRGRLVTPRTGSHRARRHAPEHCRERPGLADVWHRGAEGRWPSGKSKAVVASSGVTSVSRRETHSRARSGVGAGPSLWPSASAAFCMRVR